MAVGTYALTTLAKLKTYMGISASTDDTMLEYAIDAASAKIERYIDFNILSRSYIEMIDPRGSDKVVLRNKPVTLVSCVGFGSRPCMSFSLDSTASDYIAATVTVTTDSTVNVAGVTITLSRYQTTGSAATTSSSNAKSASAQATALSSSPWVVSVVGDDVRTEFMHAIGTTDAMNGTVYATCPSRFSTDVRVDADRGIVYRVSDWIGDDAWDLDDDSHFGTEPQSMLVRYTAGYATVPYDIETACQKVAATIFRERKRDLGVSSESLGDYSYVNRGASSINEILEEELAGWKKAR